MEIIKNTINSKEFNITEDILVTLKKHFPCEISQIIFFDIETTGFSRKTNICYLIGATYYNDNSWHYIQWFAESPDEEIDIIKAFDEFSMNYNHILHFNGDNFDLPFVNERWKKYSDIPLHINEIESHDFLKTAKQLSSLLSLENYKQKNIEKFLEIYREDIYSGKDLIKIYSEYYMKHKHFILTNSSENQLELIQLKRLILTHNRDDIIGLLYLTKLICYYPVIDTFYSIKNISIYDTTDYKGNTIKELSIFATLPNCVPITINKYHEPFSIIIKDNVLQIRCPIIEDNLRYYYPNYKDYFYLPKEDKVIHKSIATYVDSTYKQKASADNCYVTKDSSFIQLPMNSDLSLYKNVFKTELKSKYNYVELNTSLTENMDSLKTFVKDVISSM